MICAALAVKVSIELPWVLQLGVFSVASLCLLLFPLLLHSKLPRLLHQPPGGQLHPSRWRVRAHEVSAVVSTRRQQCKRNKWCTHPAFVACAAPPGLESRSWRCSAAAAATTTAVASCPSSSDLPTRVSRHAPGPAVTGRCKPSHI